MTLNFYVMPVTASTGRHGAQIAPTYRSTYAAFNNGFLSYGGEPACLVAVVDIDTATDAALTAFADCSGLPANLDQPVAGARATIQADLEAVNMPGTWVLTTNTWRDVVLFIAAACVFAQTFQGQTGGRWFGGAVTLDSTFSSLGAGARNGLTAAAQSLGLDTSGFTGASTLRQIIQFAVQQLIAAGYPLFMCGVSLYSS